MTETEQTDDTQLQVGDVVERVYVAFTLLGGVVAVLVVVRALLGLSREAKTKLDDTPKGVNNL